MVNAYFGSSCLFKVSALWRTRKMSGEGGNSSRGGGQSIRVGRVRQLDAHNLDEDLLELLVSQARSALSWFQVRRKSGRKNYSIMEYISLLSSLQPRLIESFTPELKAVMSGMVMCSSVLQDKPTPGQQVQDLRWANNSKLPSSRDIWESHARQQLDDSVTSAPASANSSDIGEQESIHSTKETTKISHEQQQDPLASRPRTEGRPWLTPRQRYIYTLAYVAVKWAWDRLQRYVEENDWREHSENIWKQVTLLLIDLVNKILKVGCLLNSLQFLAHGRFPSLLSRLTNIRMMPNSPFPFYPSPAYDIMNRQLLWDTFLVSCAHGVLLKNRCKLFVVAPNRTSFRHCTHM